MHTSFIHPSIIPFFPLAFGMIFNNLLENSFWVFLCSALLCSASQGKKYTEGCRGVHFIPFFFLLAFGMIFNNSLETLFGCFFALHLKGEVCRRMQSSFGPTFQALCDPAPTTSAPSMGENLTCYITCCGPT